MTHPRHLAHEQRSRPLSRCRYQVPLLAGEVVQRERRGGRPHHRRCRRGPVESRGERVCTVTEWGVRTERVALRVEWGHLPPMWSICLARIFLLLSGCIGCIGETFVSVI